jgi:pectate lyase
MLTYRPSRALFSVRRSSIAVVIAALSLAPGVVAALPAFPGAEGFGAIATGGRGGSVIKVTTLNATGPGSLQEAIDAPGPRIIVFDVSGVIDGDITITHGDVTIAGQTAPGGGVTIKGRLLGEYDASVQNMILRFLRVRPVYDGSAGDQFDAAQLSLNSRVILDHMSIAWGVDETVDLYEADDVTVQWSTIEESATQGHPEGEHNYGLINGPDGHRIAVHHNLFVHHKNRNPAIANGPAEGAEQRGVQRAPRVRAP